MGEVGSLAAMSQAVGGASSAAQGIAQAGAYRSMGKYQQRLANTNAKIAELQAADAISRGKKAQAIVGEQGRAVESEQRAALAAGGTDVNSGTAAQIQTNTSALSYLDQLTVENNAALEALGYKMEATNLTAAGRIAKITGRSQAAQSLLSGGMGFAQHMLAAGAIYDKYHVRVPVSGGATEPMPGKADFTDASMD